MDVPPSAPIPPPRLVVEPERRPPPIIAPADPRARPGWVKALGPVGVVLLVGLNFAGKVKFVVGPLAKLLPMVLKTGGTMFLSIWFYALSWGWWYAAGFVGLIFVHECGHLLAARRFGLKVGAPVFIPFMGAFIALKQAPRNAWVEAWVGIGGPLLGSFAAGLCHVLSQFTGEPLFRALAYSGFMLNLFNLAPIGFLDGGRIVTAISPWLWVAGLAVAGTMLFFHVNVLLIGIVVLGLPRLWSLFRRKSDEERRYFEVTARQRATMAALYFGLIAFLVFAMQVTHVAPLAR